MARSKISAARVAIGVIVGTAAAWVAMVMFATKTEPTQEELAKPTQEELAKLPMWQRQLRGEDAMRAMAIKQKIDESTAKDDYAGAIKGNEDLVALRTAAQGVDHWETLGELQNVDSLRKISALEPNLRKLYRMSCNRQSDAEKFEAYAYYEMALRIRKQMLEMCRKCLGEEHPDTAASYDGVASNLNSLGGAAEARPLFEKALAIRRKVYGDNHPDTASSYHGVALNLHALGQPVEAQPPFEKSLEIWHNAFGENHPNTATAYGNLALNLQALGQAAEAQPFLEKSLEINRRVLGENHPNTALNFDAVANNLHSLGRAAEAQPLFEKALEIQRKVLGENHPDTAATYSNLAKNLSVLGRAAEAQPFFEKALEINRWVLGENHPGTAICYNNVAGNLSVLGKVAEAQPLVEKALGIYRKAHGENHPDTAASYNGVASSLHSQGRAAEARPLFEKVLEIRRKVYGENHPDTADSYSNLATILEAQGRAAEAQPLFEKALEINRQLYGEGHPSTAASYNSVANNLNSLGRAAEAQPLVQKALEIHRKVYGENHPATAASYNDLAAIFAALGRATEAQPLYQKALEIRREVYGENHPDTAGSYNNVASNLNALGKAAEAQPLFVKALEIYRKVYGEEYHGTTLQYSNVAFNQLALAQLAEAKVTLVSWITSFEASRLRQASGLERANLTGLNPRFLMACLRATDSPNEAWRQLELSLARGLFDQRNTATRLTPAEHREEQSAIDRLASLQLRILKLVTNSQRSTEENQELEALLGKRRKESETVARLAVADSERAIEDPARIQAALGSHAALVYWVDVADDMGKVQEHWGCVVRRDGEPKWQRLPGSGADGKWVDDDDQLPNQLRSALAADGTPLAKVEVLAKKLHAHRIAPLLPHLAGVKTLYCVTVGEMAGIPVSVFTDDFAVSYLPSGSYLASLQAQPRSANTAALALGDAIFTDPESKPTAPKPLPTGGVLLTQVVPGGAAANAKFQAGDVLLKYGDAELTNIKSLQNAIAAALNAKTVKVTVWRETAEKPLVRELPPGELGALFDQQPVSVALAGRRKADAMLAMARGGGWNDLPGTRVETNRLRALFGDQCQVLNDSAASEQRLEALRTSGELKKFRYLHFATHGEGNSVMAFESSLILAQDKLPKDPISKPDEPFMNGQLSAREVLDFWKLDADLVTLSACETAIGKQGGGDGLLGFAQAFLTAGSRSVCLSLWKVDDTATSLLMSRFYENLLGQRDGLAKPLGKAAALDEARRWLRGLDGETTLALTAKMTKGVVRGDRAKGETFKLALPSADAKAPPTKATKPFAHPKYWAAFILIGDPN